MRPSYVKNLILGKNYADISWYVWIQSFSFQVIRPRKRPAHQNRERHDDFVMRAPGALHHARFMASCLYILKLSLLVDNLPPGLITPNMRVDIDRMAVYIAIFHRPWFLRSSLAAAAPRQDLELWQTMSIFEVNNSQQQCCNYTLYLFLLFMALLFVHSGDRCDYCTCCQGVHHSPFVVSDGTSCCIRAIWPGIGAESEGGDGCSITPDTTTS